MRFNIYHQPLCGNVQSEFYNLYKQASGWLRLLARSEIRIKILTSLNDGSKNLGELREVLDLSSSTILHSMRDMEIEGLIENTNAGYTLTNVGRIQAILLHDLIKAIAVLSKDKDFWLTHDLSGIPDHLLKRFWELSDCEIMMATPDDLLKPFSKYTQQIMKAKEMKGVSPVFHPDFPNVMNILLNKKTDVELIITRKVATKIMGAHRGLLENSTAEPNFRLWVTDEDLNVNFTVTESAFSMGLFRNDGIFDISIDLFAYASDALNWGRDLFEYYRKRSQIVKIDDI
ncbi:MAG: winged helix-turn-helix domain-containing protein [Halobacteriota archaeon]|nr:winged helix-turn-helix domain-containing protein [Halobacteriota archaeon]